MRLNGSMPNFGPEMAAVLICLLLVLVAIVGVVALVVRKR